ncbi:MAG: hypothetical protein E7168_01670 [Firmicutes bacterium]|nr:hypothetical protein [Bacillota bacterium]
MKELDTTLAGLANRNSAANRIERERIMKNSIHQPHMEQRIHGEVYVGKTSAMERFIKTAIPVALGIAAIVITVKVGVAADEIDTYNNTFNQVAQESLTERQQELYEQDHDSVFERIEAAFEHHNQIEENKEILKATGDYDWQGNKIGEKTEIQDPDALIQITQLQQDAIDMAVDEEIKEYQSRR